MESLTRVRNAAQGLQGAAAHAKGATPARVIARRGPARLLAYGPESAAPPLLIVTPIINRFRLVDLDHDSSVPAFLAARGIPVHVVDWGEPRRIDAGLDFDDYVCRILPYFLERLAAPQVDLLGYCLGGTISVMFAARFPERVRRLATCNTPVDFRDMDLMSRWVSREAFPVERVTEAFGNMPGHLVSQGFDWLRPVSSALKLGKAWERFTDADFAERFFTLESWNRDAVDVPGAAYRRLIGDLYRDNRLIAKTLILAGAAIDLSRINSPTLVIAAREDNICPPAAARALLDHISSKEQRYLEVRGGHIASIIGPRARPTVYEPLAEWFA